MNCHDIERLLAEGQPLSPEARAHTRQCEGCRSLLEALATPDDQIDLTSFPSSLGNLLPGMNSVRPLPSDRWLVLLTAGTFSVFTLLIASIVGFQGFLHMTPLERIVYYGVVSFFAVLFSVNAVQCAIPGAKVRINRGVTMTGAVIAVALTVIALFPNFGLDDFVDQGVPCLRLGCICGALFGVLAAIVLRRGYVTDTGAALLLIGCFAGFSGVGVLSLHCPVQNAAHIIVWHLGAVAVSVVSGLIVGLIKRI